MGVLCLFFGCGGCGLAGLTELMMIKYILCLIFILFVPWARLEARDTVVPLGIGGRLPVSFWELERPLYRDGAVEMGSLGSAKGRLLIVDFWASYCAPCIVSLGHLNSLQKLFGERLMVLGVNSEKKSLQEAFLRGKFGAVRFLRAGGMVGDLRLMFPYLSIPHQIWIRDGKVLFITDTFAATESNIRKVLAGERVDVFFKKEAVDFKPSRPLFVNGNGGDGRTLSFQSVIAGYADGVEGSAESVNVAGKGDTTVVMFPNRDILGLYRRAAAYSVSAEFMRPTRSLIEIKDVNNRFVSFTAVPKTQVREFWRKYGFMYNLVCPGGISRERVFDYMFKDLNRYFAFYNLVGKVEERVVDCYVLERSGSGAASFASKGGAPGFRADKGLRSWVNMPLSNVVSIIQNQYSVIKLPIVDGTGFGGNVDIKIDTRVLDLDGLLDSLAVYGLTLNVRKVSLPMLVITDLDPGAVPVLNLRERGEHVQ
jgi:thiol-disulfide isomerase/thioredoxin